MYLQNGLAAVLIRRTHGHPSVKAAGAQQRLVEHVGTVGRGEDDDAFARGKAVHLGQDLIQSLLALVVAAEGARTAGTPDGVELIDENDGRGSLAGLFEQVPHATRADAD